MRKPTNRIVQLLISVMCLSTLVLLPLAPLPAEAKNVQQLQMEKRSKQQKLKEIQHIKKQIMVKERFVNANILRNQQRLDTTRHSLEMQAELLQRAKGNLSKLEDDLSQALDDQQTLSEEVGKRLKSFYMGENLGTFEMLLDAGDITTLLDRIYYKKRIFAQDKSLLTQYQLKTQALAEKKQALAQQKVRLAETIESIQTYQGQLHEAMEVDKLLLNKLQTSRRAYEMAQEQLLRESAEIETQIQHLTGTIKYVAGSTGRFLRPVLAGITSGFGYRYHPIHHTTKFHSGLDFGARYGSAIHATDGGVVIYAGWRGGYGKVVIVNHGTHRGVNITSLYGHMSGTAVGVGQRVSPGQIVGYVGSTGLSTGPHLHFEIRENGHPVNPLGYVH